MNYKNLRLACKEKSNKKVDVFFTCTLKSIFCSKNIPNNAIKPFNTRIHDFEKNLKKSDRVLKRGIQDDFFCE